MKTKEKFIAEQQEQEALRKNGEEIMKTEWIEINADQSSRDLIKEYDESLELHLGIKSK